MGQFTLAVTRSNPQAWITSDNIPGGLSCYRVFYPENYLHSLLGALFNLTREENWQTVGSETAESVASAFNGAYLKTLKGGACMPTGAITAFAGTLVPTGYLLCDGAQYDKNDYPELFNTIGFTWGGSGDNFNVPDMRDKFALGAGAIASLAQSGGAQNVTLTQGQLPNHFHTIPSVSLIPVQVGAGTFVIGLYPAGNYYTNIVGSDQPHENMPPFVGVKYIIKA